MAEWTGIVQTTAARYLKDAQDNTVRNRFLLKKLEKDGRITYNHNGYNCIWDVKYAEPTPEAFGDGFPITYQRSDLFRQLQIDWRGYMNSDLMTLKEECMNSGDLAIVERYSRIIPDLVQGLTNKFSGELLINGNAAGNENRLHGLETFMTVSGSTVVSGDSLNQNTVTNYGGLSTVLGAMGGTWSANLATSPNAANAKDWPDGQGDPQYDFLSPKLVNVKSTVFGSGGNGAWRTSASYLALRQARIWIQQTCGNGSAPNVAILSGDAYNGLLISMDSLRNLWLPWKEATDLGFGDVMNFEGIAVQADYDVPAGTGYLMDTSNMEICSLQEDLFSARGPIYDPKTASYLFHVGFFGNVRYSPKHFAKLALYA